MNETHIEDTDELETNEEELKGLVNDIFYIIDIEIILHIKFFSADSSSSW